MHKKIRLTEGEFHRIVQEINEGLIKSYDMDICQKYLARKFPNIRRIVSLEDNPYLVRGKNVKTKYNDFVGIVIDPGDIQNFKEIIQTANHLLGWFAGHICVRQKIRNGYLEFNFLNYNGRYICSKERWGDVEIMDYLKDNPPLVYFAIILEAKFGERYHQKPGEVFFHATDVTLLPKILKNGLVPRSKGNFPERIYLGKDITEIGEMVGGAINDMVILKVDVSNVRLFTLYRDQRNPTAVFTYDNIPPAQIEILEN